MSATTLYSCVYFTRSVSTEDGNTYVFGIIYKKLLLELSVKGVSSLYSWLVLRRQRIIHVHSVRFSTVVCQRLFCLSVVHCFVLCSLCCASETHVWCVPAALSPCPACASVRDERLHVWPISELENVRMISSACTDSCRSERTQACCLFSVVVLGRMWKCLLSWVKRRQVSTRRCYMTRRVQWCSCWDETRVLKDILPVTHELLRS